jgi:nicotinate-nucleotide pyrophosphorylase (carboxylating)
MRGSLETKSAAGAQAQPEGPDPTAVQRAVRAALDEDCAADDVTTRWSVDADARGRAEFVAKVDGVVAGLEVARATFQIGDPGVRMLVHLPDGTRVGPGDVIADVSGSLRSLLTLERTALNFLQRLSGIATLTARYCEAVAGTHAKIFDTRKTAPGLRTLDKYAVLVGGGHNHRMHLGAMVLLKENHIAASGGIEAAVERIRANMRSEERDLEIEVEVETLEQFRTALSLRVDWIMLDNMSLDDMRRAVHDAAQDAGWKPTIEASGNVTLDTAGPIAAAGVDVISVGSLTHSAPALDLTFLVR